MKRICKVFSLVLAMLMLLSALSCESQKEETKTNETTTVELSEKEKTAANKKAVLDFIKEYREGKYADKTTFSYEDFSVYFDLCEYKGLRFPKDALIEESVSDERVSDYLTTLLIAAKVSDNQYTTFTEGAVQKFDMVTIDYKGIIDGVEEKNATAADQELLIGSGSYIAGFEEGLIGKEIGKEVRLDLSFSPYYAGKDVAGKAVTFYVTVKKVQRPAIPELTVEVINEIYSTSFKTVEEAKADLKKDLEAEQKSRAYSYITTYLQNQVVANSRVIEYPEKEMQHYRDHFANYYAQYMGEETSWEKFCEEELGMSYDEFKQESEKYAKESVEVSLMIKLIAQKEKISCTDEQLEAYILGIYENQGASYGNAKSLIVDYIDIYGADYFENQVLSASVAEFLYHNAAMME